MVLTQVTVPVSVHAPSAVPIGARVHDPPESVVTPSTTPLQSLSRPSQISTPLLVTVQSNSHPLS